MGYQVTVGNGLLHSFYKYPDKTAIVFKDRRLTYRELNQRVNQLAHGLLDLGLKKGDKLSIMLNNCSEWIEIAIACGKTGVIAVPINFRFTGQEVEHCVNDSDSRFIIVGEEFLPVIEPVKENFTHVASDNYIVVGENATEQFQEYEAFIASYPDWEPDIEILESDILYIGYTSGTTGKPKGAMFSHRSRLFMQGYSAAEFQLGPSDIQLLVMPLFHSNGLVFGLMGCTMGGTVVITQPFDPVEFLSLIEQEKVNYVSVVPTILNIIFSFPEEVTKEYDVSSLSKVICSSSPLLSSVKEKTLQFFESAELSEFYGSSEAGLVTILHHREAPEKVHCVGRPCMGMNVKIFNPDGEELPSGEVGELYSWGVSFEGYYKQPEATDQAFLGEWLTVGDMARMDEEGYVYLVDRKQDMIISGGENVYPTEVEEVMSKHPAVAELAIIGVPDEKWGESIKAVVVLEPGAEADQEELIKYCRENLADYKCPKSVEFTNELPKTLTGKILRRLVREKYWTDRNSSFYD